MLCSRFSFAATTTLEMSGRGRRRDRLLFSALPPSSPGDALERNGTVRGSVSARRRQQRQARAASESRPVRSGREPKGTFNRLPRFVAQNPGLPRGPCPAREYVRVPKWTSQWRFWNDRFPPIPLKNSEIEPLRKSRFRARRVISADSSYRKAYGRVAGSKLVSPPNP